MTAWGNVDLAVEAMRRGARDFIQKPWENERLLAILRTQVELHRALQRAERLAAEKQLLAYKHEGFWQAMDTLRDRNQLEELWLSGRAPWRTWA